MSARTVKVRVAVAVGNTGQWVAAGSTGHDDPMADASACVEMNGGEPEDVERVAQFWLTAELPIPDAAEPEEVEAEVSDGV